MKHTDAGDRLDLSPLQGSEEKTSYAVPLYHFITQINQAISHEREEQALFEQACRIAVDTYSFDFAWIGIPDAGSRHIRMVASAGITEADRIFFKDYKFDQDGPIDRILKGASHHFISDILNQPNAAFSAYAKERGFISAICLGIRNATTTIGTFNLYSTQRSFFDESEIALLTQVASDVSFAIAQYDKGRERREGEKRLQSEHIKLKQAHSLAKIGGYKLDVATGTAAWSEELLQIYGLPLEDKDHKLEFWLSHIHPEDLASVNEWMSTISVGTNNSITHRILRPNGEIRNITSSAQYLPDDDGNPMTMIGIGQDITEIIDTTRALLASENALRNSELRYQQILELAQEGIWVLNQNGETIFTNQKVSEILKYSSAEMYGQETSFFVEETQKWQDVLVQKWLSGSNGIFEICLRAKDETHVWVNMSSRLMSGDDQNPHSIITTISDITENKQVAEKDRFKANLLNMIGQAVVASDMEGTITYWNKGAQSMYGLKPLEALGRNIFELMPEQTSKASGIIGRLAAGKTWSGEIISRRSNQELFPALMYNAPVFSSNKDIIGMVGVLTDLSSQKELERRLEKVNRQSCYGTWEADLRCNILTWSDIVREIHEVPADFVPDIHKAINFYKPGEGRKAITEALDVLIETGASFDVELEIITAKGNLRWVRATGDGEFSGKRCIKIFGSFQDITKRKNTELELERLLYEKDLILGSIGEAFFVVDKAWHISYFSIQAQEFLPVDSKDIVGQNFWDVFPETIDTIFNEQYEKAFETKLPVNFDGYYAPLKTHFSVNAFPSGHGLTIFFKKKQSEVAVPQ